MRMRRKVKGLSRGGLWGRHLGHRLRPQRDRSGVGTTEGEEITSEADFEGVTEWGFSNGLDPRPRHEPHLHEASRHLATSTDLVDDGALADRKLV